MLNLGIRIGFLACALVLARAQPGPAAPRIVAVKGTVTFTRAGSAAETPAAVGMTLSAGDQVATAGRASTEVQFDNRVFQIAGNTAVLLVQAQSGAYRVAVGRGTVTCHVVAAPTATLDLTTPSVFLKPDAAGACRIAVTAAGESQITAQEGNVEVFAPAGSAWVVAGRKMLARGPQDNPEFKIVNSVSNWRKFLTIAMMSIQIAGDASADFSGGHSHTRPERKTAAAASGPAHPVGARPPAARPSSPGRGK